MCASRRPQELIEFHLYGTTISVLRVLNQKHHEEGDDRGAGIDDELPGIAKVKQRSGNTPKEDDENCHSESGGLAGKPCAVLRKVMKLRGVFSARPVARVMRLVFHGTGAGIPTELRCSGEKP